MKTATARKTKRDRPDKRAIPLPVTEETSPLVARRSRIYNYYSEGKSFREIARIENISHMQVSRDLHAELSNVQEAHAIQSPAGLRQLHLGRLQEALKSIYPYVLKGNFKAIGIMLNLMEREAKLLGLDAPTKIDIEGRILALARIEGLDASTAMRIARQAAEEEQRRIVAGE